jgi:hypothetical protein
VSLLNKIIRTATGYDIYFETNSQRGFQSNYNLLYTTGTGQVGFLQKTFANLKDWQFPVGLH